MLTWVGLAFFGALGAVARFRVDSAVSARLPSAFPLGTLVVNLTGSFALGILVGASATHRIAFVLGTGFLGGYTTFSTWMVESERLGGAGDVVALARNLWLPMLAGVAIAAAGFYVIERELTTMAELEAIVTDYLQQAQIWDAIPAAGACCLLAELQEQGR